MCRSYGDQFESLLKDKRDISSYLKRQLELRNEQVFDLNDRLIGLEQSKAHEKDLFEKALQNLKDKSRAEIEQLQSENKLLKTRLVALEEFKSQRQTMEKTIEDFQNLIIEKENAYRQALDQMEISLITFKNRLKKEAIAYLNDLAIEFHRHTKSQISQTVKRAIHENFYLNNQIDYLTKQLETSIQSNRKSTDDNQQLTRTIAVLEDLETQSGKKFFATENIIRMLCKKLKECQEREKIIGRVKLPLKMIQKESETQTVINDTHQPEIFVERDNFQEENILLKDIIDRAARAIVDVVQSENEILNIEKRDEMLEQFLALLLTSHRLSRTSLPLQTRSSLEKGIFPGTRLDLHRIHPDSSTAKITSHYRPGDLGIVPPNTN